MKYCYECGTRQTSASTGQVPPYYTGQRYEDRAVGKSFGVAAALSLLFPGLGHVYLKQAARGLGFAAFAGVLLFMTVIAIGMQMSIAGEVMWMTVVPMMFMALIVYALCINDCHAIIKKAIEDEGILSADEYGRL